MKNFNRNERSGPRRNFDRRDSGRRGFGGRGEKREMFKVVCDECGKDCEVPFQPTDGRPVYCSECFEKKDGGSQAPRSFQDRGDRDRGPRRPNFERREGPRPHRNEQNEQLEEIGLKLDRILETLSLLVSSEKKSDEPEEVKESPRKKTKKSDN